jgi:transcriptional regulator with XRE-family HTH domain
LDFFGSQLRALRIRRALSQSALGARVHASGDLISKIEKGQRRPMPDLIDRLDLALDANGRLIRLSSTLEPARHGADRTRDGVVGQGGDFRSPITTLGQSSGREVLAALRQTAAGMRRLDHGLGSDMAIGAMAAHVDLVESLVGRTTGQLQREVFSTLAEIRQLLGWMLFDQRGVSAARATFLSAREFAERADDDALVAFIVGPSLAFAETYHGDPRSGALRSEEALVWAKRAGNDRLTAFVLAIGARASAKLGDRADCLQKLRGARRYLSSSNRDGSDPIWLEVFDEAALYGHWGSCLLDLGEPSEAVGPLLDQEGSAPQAFVRNRVIWLLDRVRAHLELSELDEACDTLVRALDAAAGTSSHRVQQRFRAFDGALSQWSSLASVNDIRDRLHLMVAE